MKREGTTGWQATSGHGRIGRATFPGFAALALAAALVVPAAAATAAPLVDTLPTSVRLLASIGCARVPEASGPTHAELQCADDRSFLLCTSMQAEDTRLDCAIDAAGSKVDLGADPSVFTRRPAFAALAEARPCVAWAYPDPGPDKLRHGARCAAGILATLRCTAAADGATSCPAAARPACDALHAAGYAAACTIPAPR